MRLSVVETTEPGGLADVEVAVESSLQNEVELGASPFICVEGGPFCKRFCKSGI